MCFFIFINYVLCVFGLSYLLVFYDGPFDIIPKIRRLFNYISPSFGKVLDCPVCTSTWVGLIFSLLNYFFISIPITPWNFILNGSPMWYVIAILDMFTASGFVMLIHYYVEWLEK